MFASMKTLLSSGSASSVKGIAPQSLRQLASGHPEGAPALVDQALTGSRRLSGEVGLERGFQELIQRLPLPCGSPFSPLEQSLVEQRSDLPSHRLTPARDLSV